MRTGARIQGGARVEVFPYYAAHPESDEPFNEAMVAASGVVPRPSPGLRLHAVREDRGRGGRPGGLLTAILRAAPDARGGLSDQRRSQSGARASVEARGWGARETEGGDLLRVGAGGGDAYVLSGSSRLGRRARAPHPAQLPAGDARRAGRLLLVEGVVPEGNEPSMAKMMDLQMLVMTGGRERTAREFRALLAEAGFEMTRVVATNSPVSIVEAVGAGERS